jgi:hypothetical protein
MVTGHRRGFANMPDVAVQCFLEQDTKDCELLILNHGTKNFSGERVRDIKISKDPYTHVGEMYNLAFYLALGNHLLVWDDDDWHAPNRVSWQGQYAARRTVTVLKRRIFLNLLTGKAGVRTAIDCGFGSMLYPRETRSRYPNRLLNSDVNFFLQFDGAKRYVDNPPELFVRTFHGANLNGAGADTTLLSPLTRDQQVLVDRVKKLYQAGLGPNGGVPCNVNLKETNLNVA